MPAFKHTGSMLSIAITRAAMASAGPLTPLGYLNGGG